MNQDLLNGTRSLAKGNVRHLHGERGPAREALEEGVRETAEILRSVI